MRHRPDNLFDRYAGRWAEGPLSPALLAGLALAILTFNSVSRASAASCVPAPAGLVGWWPGDGNADAMAGGNHGTLQGSAIASAAGQVSEAFGFDGTNGYVQIPDSPALRPTNLTVEAWVRFSSLNSAGNSPAGQQYIVFKQNTRSGSFEGYYLGKERLAGSDNFHFAVSSSAGELADTASATLVQTGVWYHVAGVRGGNFIQLYVNGQLESQAGVSFAQDYGNFPLYFGSSGQSYWDHKFAGSLDEVSLYNRALSSNEIAAIYLAGVAGKCKGAQFTFTTNSGTITITGYIGPGGGVNLPDRIDDLPVTSIGVGAFRSCTTLTNVTIPESVTSIGADAFADCVRLANITIPSRVTSIGARAFVGCTSLSAITVAPDNPAYSSVDGVWFDKHQSMLRQYPASKTGSDYSIPGSVNNIGAEAFRSCTRLTNVTIPDSVAGIGDEAFYWCINLTNLTIPSSVTRLGMAAFRACSSLSTITVAANNPVYSSVSGVLFNKHQTTLLQYPAGKADSDYSIPSSVTSIGDQAFYNCYRLTSVTIPDGLTSIGSEAFWACRGLTAVTLPDSVTSLGGGAFSLCIGLTRVTVGSGLTRIGPYTFGSCSSLSSLAMGNSVTNIGAYAFQGCKGLTSLKIPGSVTSIGSRAFEHCTGLTHLTIPDRVTRIESEAFHWCTGLTRVTLGTNVTDLGDDAFAYCSSLTSITIPNSVTNIGAEAFWWCFALTSVYFKGDAPRVGADVFAGVSNVTVYYLPGTAGWNPQVQRPVVPPLAARTNGFGFTIVGATGMVVLVEACTDLGAPLWSRVGTNRLADGFSHFSDPQWTNYSRRFYRLSGTTLGGRPTALWNPQIHTRNTRFSGQTNPFGFDITGTADIPIVLEACTNLATASWSVLQACTLTNGSIYFSEPNWTNYPARFYRIRSP